MIWTPESPKTTGTFRWRENAEGRIHIVIVRVDARKNTVEYACKSMDLRRVVAGGEWSPKLQAAAPRGFGDSLIGDLNRAKSTRAQP